MDALQMAEHKRMSSLCRNQRAEQKVYEKTLQYESAKEKFEKVFDKTLRCESAKKKLEKKMDELNLAKRQLAKAETVLARDEEKVDAVRLKLTKRVIREAYILNRKFVKYFSLR